MLPLSKGPSGPTIWVPGGVGLLLGIDARLSEAERCRSPAQQLPPFCIQPASTLLGTNQGPAHLNKASTHGQKNIFPDIPRLIIPACQQQAREVEAEEHGTLGQLPIGIVRGATFILKR